MMALVVAVISGGTTWLSKTMLRYGSSETR